MKEGSAVIDSEEGERGGGGGGGGGTRKKSENFMWRWDRRK